MSLTTPGINTPNYNSTNFTAPSANPNYAAQYSGVPAGDLYHELDYSQGILYREPDGTVWIKYDDGSYEPLPSGGGGGPVVVATDTIQGIVELATTAEVQAGTAGALAVTPASLLAALPVLVPNASTTIKGIVELATQAEVETGAAGVLAVTPASLLAALPVLVPNASTTVNGITRYSTTGEAVAGTDNTEAVTPLGASDAFKARVKTFLIGNGVANPITITHNMGLVFGGLVVDTLLANIQVRIAATKEIVNVRTVVTNVSQVEIGPFSVIPTLDQYEVIIRI